MCVPGLLFTPAWVHSLSDSHINQVSSVDLVRVWHWTRLLACSRGKGIQSITWPISLCFLKGISENSIWKEQESGWL